MSVPPLQSNSTPATRRRYAIVGLGSRRELYQDGIETTHARWAELVALCDLNPGRIALARARSARNGAPVPPGYRADAFAQMLRECRPDVVIVATVDAAGVVTVVGHGEGAVTAWFSSNIALASIVSPFLHQIPAEVFQAAARSNLIDDLVLEKLAKLHLKPSPRTQPFHTSRRPRLRNRRQQIDHGRRNNSAKKLPARVIQNRLAFHPRLEQHFTNSRTPAEISVNLKRRPVIQHARQRASLDKPFNH